MPKYVDETGNKYGKLTVIKDAGRDKHGGVKWFCKCDCGTFNTIRGSHLRQGLTNSCGCTTIKHNMSRHLLYGVYKSAVARCTDSTRKEYKNYGGRGIEFRLGTIQEFVERMLPTWVKGLTLGRIDNDGHYEYGNIRWETRKQQGANMRSNVKYKYYMCELILRDWAIELSITQQSLQKRIRKWGLERALTTPVKRRTA